MMLATTALLDGCGKEKEPTEPSNNSTEPNGDWVDLGLPSGLLWATRNVGATSPEDYGDYFAWGETTPKSVYNWSNYRYCNGSARTLTKYCFYTEDGLGGFIDTLTILQPGDDAATANYGGRTPNGSDWLELIEHTTSTWTTLNGVNGRCFVGSNGNSIFLPASGLHWDSLAVNVGGYSTYWSSSLSILGSPLTAKYFGFGSDKYRLFYEERCYGLSVRAVRSTR